MADDNANVKYKATMTREQWRNMYVKCENSPLGHRATLTWLSAATAELFDVAEVIQKASSGKMMVKPFEKGKPEDPVTLELSRNAVQGIKLVSIRALVGGEATQGGGVTQPASLFNRKYIFDSLRGVGPNETLLRLVQKEAVLPETADLDEAELDLDEKPKE